MSVMDWSRVRSTDCVSCCGRGVRLADAVLGQDQPIFHLHAIAQHENLPYISREYVVRNGLISQNAEDCQRAL